MKEQQQSAVQRKLKPQAFVSALVKDPSCPPKLQVIRGYIGESNASDHTRVYLDVALHRYVDVPNNGIANVEDISGGDNQFGGVLMWVTQDAQILHRGNWAASEDPTTMATGEEGGGDPTTMATGEESLGFQNPMDLVVNPFGRF